MYRVKKKCRNNVLLKLQRDYQAVLRQHRLLALQNELLRQREQFLLEAVQEQGDNLHYVALAAFQQEQQLLQACTCADPEACTCGAGEIAAITATLLDELKVYEMLQMVGAAAATGGAAEPNTTRWMRAAITPERVKQIRNSSLQDISATLCSLTMRMTHMLHTPPARLALMGGASLEDVVFEYGEMAMLLHVAADRSNLEIGVLNLETLERQEPPEGHWEFVLESLDLRPDQVDTLCTGFEQYLAKSAPVIAEMQELGRRMQQLTGAPAHGLASAAAEDSPCTRPGTDDGKADGSSAGESHDDKGDLDASAAEVKGGSSGSRGLLNGSNKGSGKSPTPAAADTSAAGVSAADKLKAKDPAAPIIWQQQQQQQVAHPPPELPLPSQHQQLYEADKEQQQQQCPNFDIASTHLQMLDVYADLEETMKQLLNRVMKLRELHRTVTYLFLNILDTRQSALVVVRSYPFWSRPLSMTRILAQQRGITTAAAAGRTATGATPGQEKCPPQVQQQGTIPVQRWQPQRQLCSPAVPSTSADIRYQMQF